MISGRQPLRHLQGPPASWSALTPCVNSSAGLSTPPMSPPPWFPAGTHGRGLGKTAGPREPTWTCSFHPAGSHPQGLQVKPTPGRAGPGHSMTRVATTEALLLPTALASPAHGDHSVPSSPGVHTPRWSQLPCLLPGKQG